MITQEIRNEHYSHLSKAGLYLYSHPESGVNLKEIANRHNIVENYATFGLTVGDIILGFYKIEDTIPLLQQELDLDPNTAAALGAEVLAFLAPLSDPNWQPPEDESVEDEDMAEGENASENTGMGEAVSIPITTSVRIPLKSPSFITAPKPLHTFASDMEAVRETSTEFETTTTTVIEPTPSLSAVPHLPVPQAHIEPTYQSSQPTVTREPLSSIPSYTPSPTATPTAPAAEATPAPDRPRWSTDV